MISAFISGDGGAFAVLASVDGPFCFGVSNDEGGVEVCGQGLSDMLARSAMLLAQKFEFDECVEMFFGD
jgi:hypothetical protein